MELQHKYDVMLLTFVSFLMVLTGCDEEEATKRIATLCAVTQTKVFDPIGETIEKNTGRPQ